MSDEMRPIEMSCDDIREIAGAFVLGALDPAEEAAVRAHLASCLDAHAEIAEVGRMLPVFDASVPQVEPPARLKSRIMAAAAADLAERQGVAMAPVGRASVSPVVDAPTAPVSVVPAPVIAFPSAGERAARAARRTSTLTWATRIAAVLIIGVLGAWNVLLQGQLGPARDYQDHVAAVLDLAGKPGSLTAILAPTSGQGPAGLAAVGADGSMAIAMREFAPTDGSEVYEAWMIGPDKVPIPLGGFKVGTAGIAYFQASGVPAQPGITLAFTLEPGPGATAPSTSPVSLGTTISG